jgi:hypothetical protein
MAVGKSGRIVLEIEPELKHKLYSVLSLERLTLKEWFIGLAEQHIQSRQEPATPSPTPRADELH